jgi:BirA family transcriptional regulator, biotin operon repressor / biotin---[acetyl-CoA-carboxylase] ligase
LADPTFDRRRFESRLATRRLGRTLLVRAETGSTNDDAWDALATGAPDGFVVVADAQTRGRGRAGRSWHSPPGRGLAMSVLMHEGCDARSLPAVPLAAGLAVVQGLERLGFATELKWPNDVMLGGRKLAGVLVESRTRAGEPGAGDRAVVIGFGVNVSHAEADFPPELRERATSLALAGHAVGREEVAAETLGALETLWDAIEAEGPERVLRAWRSRAVFWGRRLTVDAPGGPIHGVARDLDDQGRLVLETETGERVAITVGDVA